MKNISSGASSNDDELLRCLIENSEMLRELRSEPHCKRELAEAIGKSKQTVYRKTNNVREYGLIEQSEHGYRLTNLGYILVELYDLFASHSDVLYTADLRFPRFPQEYLPPIEFFAL